MLIFNPGDTGGNVRPPLSLGAAMPRRTPRTAFVGLRTSRCFTGFLKSASICVLVAGLLSPLTQTPAAADATASNDYCGGQCSDILPPGENGNATLAQILLNQAFGTQPAHAEDQLGPYANLATGYSGLTDAKINTFFNDASFGVPSDQVASTEKPAGRGDVTIVRDKKAGVPHITGTTRYGTEFGAGYAAAQDRLWLMDVFRHVGRGQLTAFAGGAAANQGLEQQFYRNAPYTEADLQAQIDNAVAGNGARGQQALADANAYLAGINSYIDASDSGRYFPGEYVLTGHKDAVTNALSLIAAQSKYGVEEGTKVWESFRERNDPEAVLTVHDGQSFPYGTKPAAAQGEALPDAGSVTTEPLVYDATGTGASQSA